MIFGHEVQNTLIYNLTVRIRDWSSLQGVKPARSCCFFCWTFWYNGLFYITICGRWQPFGYVTRRFAGRGNDTTNQQGSRVVENEDLIKQVKELHTDSKIKLIVESPNEATVTWVRKMSLYLDDFIEWLAWWNMILHREAMAWKRSEVRKFQISRLGKTRIEDESFPRGGEWCRARSGSRSFGLAVVSLVNMWSQCFNGSRRLKGKMTI